VIAHNVETVRSLQTTVRDNRASFDRSLRTLREARAGFRSRAGDNAAAGKTKSSILLGLGETEAELLAAMDELREADVDILVLGQYLQPSKNQIPVTEYISPDTFARLGKTALEKGFASVVSSPLARTSYHAHTAFSGDVQSTS
jgi:lipoic acid synthetase